MWPSQKLLGPLGITSDKLSPAKQVLPGENGPLRAGDQNITHPAQTPAVLWKKKPRLLTRYKITKHFRKKVLCFVCS